MVNKVNIISGYIPNFDSTRGVPFWVGYLVWLFIAYVVFRVWLKLRHDKRHLTKQKDETQELTDEQLAKQKILTQFKSLGLQKFPRRGNKP
ncbi:hypothetical protein C8P68_10617 [Mucilaginibacter yixingensis]|uniref:Uncharacterized protein n=1 Tax=Mucilaginibacter yixingensis TaxID=1295612 RepID=A0A2T5J6M1_9SPHI|nr:hypothetical protein [Mucilaginibacter yixingensis]PTQ94807.1 hypothetical protein C8P68_10617 [Mucilaginibacter yixingensis]